MALSSSPLHRPSDLKRRSTGADTNHSGSGLDYYWSAVAGIGPSSSTSSLAISPSPSGGAGPGGYLSPTSPTSPSASPFHLHSRSANDLRGAAKAQAKANVEEYLLDSPKSAVDPWMPQTLSARSADSAYSLHSSMAAGSSSLPKRPKDLVLSERISHKHLAEDSPTSDASVYSNVPSPLVTSLPANDYAWHYASKNTSPITGDPRRPEMGVGTMSSDSAYSASEHTARESYLSGTSTAIQLDDMHFDPNETPVALGNRLERVLNPPSSFNYESPLQVADLPTASPPTKPSKASPIGRHSFDEGTRESSRPGAPRKASGGSKAPSSAPPWQTEFGAGPARDRADADDDTLKARRPGPSGASSTTALAPALGPQEKPRRGSDNGPTPPPPSSNMLSPERPEYVRRSSSPGEGPSPSLPPRSALRGPPSPAPSKLQLGTVPTPPQIPSPTPSTSHELPTITHTPVSPKGVSAPTPSQPTVDIPRSAAKYDIDTLSANSGASIADLTGLLEGAIDEIGLINSQETPPPTVFPKTAPLAMAAPIRTSPITDTQSSFAVADKAPAAAAPAPPTASATGSTTRQSSHVRSQASSASLRSFSIPPPSTSTSTVSPTAQPWPQAMMTGNIRNLKFAGDRAKGYAKAINELSRSESGLREWCAAASTSAHRGPSRTLSKQFTHSSLSRGDASSSTLPSYFNAGATSHPRNVSSSSEFPMREDSYAAREIIQRTIDPQDQPTALPANLPYPQLQRGPGGPVGTGGGMKSSASMASMASTASHKKGFFSAMRKGKKDSVSSLGPPNPNSGIGINMGGSGSITPSGRGSTDSRSGNLPAPVGPRDPYRGSFTPPPTGSFGDLHLRTNGAGQRGSLDTSLARPYESGRGSFESTRTAKSSLAPTGKSPLVGGDNTGQIPSGYATPREDDGGLGYMTDVLPHVERSTLRIYLGRHGDPMRAIGAYLEDEKRGKVASIR